MSASARESVFDVPRHEARSGALSGRRADRTRCQNARADHAGPCKINQDSRIRLSGLQGSGTRAISDNKDIDHFRS